MVREVQTVDADLAVVGSGPGGATVARQLARAGRKVVLLEMGKDYRKAAYYGSHLGALVYSDKRSLLFTEEGLNIIRPLMVGGATNMFCGCAAVPPSWLKERYGVDLDDYAEETVRELGVKPLPDELLGAASRRVMEAGRDLGLDWQPLPKFMDPSRGRGFDCGTKCILGCRCGSKWTAAEYVDEAVEAGCTLLTSARVDDLVIEDGQAGGVRERSGISRSRYARRWLCYRRAALARRLSSKRPVSPRQATEWPSTRRQSSTASGMRRESPSSLR